MQMTAATPSRDISVSKLSIAERDKKSLRKPTGLHLYTRLTRNAATRSARADAAVGIGVGSS
jgi:hypothetical protein